MNNITVDSEFKARVLKLLREDAEFRAEILKLMELLSLIADVLSVGADAYVNAGN